MVTKNKGEWGEFYTFLYLLAEGKLHQGDENLKKIEGRYFNIEHIKKLGDHANQVFYVMDNHIKSESIKLERSIIANALPAVMKEIILGEGAFESAEAEAMARLLGIDRISAPSHIKADMELSLTDKQKITSQTHGFSVKTLLGGDSTLINASSHTKFTYKLKGFDSAKAQQVNNINNGSKLRSRIKSLLFDDSILVAYHRMNSNHYRHNLRKIDSSLDKILANVLLFAHATGTKMLKDIVEDKDNYISSPLDLEKDQVIYKLREYLTVSSLGMQPKKKWNGETDVDGGIIMLTAEGEVLAYFLFDPVRFKKYLWDVSYIETPSMSRYDYGYCYEQDGEWYFDIVLQIRNK